MSNLGIILAIFTPFIAAMLILCCRRFLKRGSAYVSLIAATMSTILISLIGYKQTVVSQGFTPHVYYWDWVQELGISFSFLVDGLSLFFGLVVSIMGFFVIWYAIGYFPKTHRDNPRFYVYILLFMFAMLGTVFSNNLLLLFIFWEITGVVSFLLIGFHYTKKESQIGARMAFLVTATTGLLMLMGIILLGIAYQTFDWHSIVQLNPIMQPAIIGTAFLLIVIGACGKSAQFPFHFWLPNAMAAPTPVSAYLHSAAMVKLGVFLIARIYPVFVDLDSWILLSIIGFSTMLIGAIFSLLSYNIKAILAYTTISQLGYLIGFYGLGSPSGIEHDFLHILNHVLYKGSLFMIAGIVIHYFHTNDIRKMGGAAKAMPWVATACIIACASMAGIPGTTGFLSKELLLTHIFSHGQWTGLYSAILCISAACLFASGLRLVIHIFLRPSQASSLKQEPAPSRWFQFPPFILSLGLLVFGVFPKGLTAALSALHVPGLHRIHVHSVKLWHGVTSELLISSLIIVSGITVYLLFNKIKWRVGPAKWLQLDHGFNQGLAMLPQFSQHLYKGIRLHNPVAYLPIVFLFFIGLIGLTLYRFLPHNMAAIIPFHYFQIDSWFIILAPVFISILISLLISKKWNTQLICLSIIGFLVGFIFFLYKAPDLALTQLLIEVVSLVLILFLFKKLTQTQRHYDYKITDSLLIKSLKGMIAISVGVILFILIQIVQNPTASHPIGHHFTRYTVPLAGGNNAVNTILVDFRGFDTMGEISVLFIAMLGVLALLWTQSKKSKSLS